VSFISKRTSLGVLEELVRRHHGTSSGIPVTSERALRHSAVWGSLAAISEALVGLPLEEVTKSGSSVIHKDPPDLFFQPAPHETWESWIWQQVWTLAGKGRCYAMLTDFDANGWPTEMVPIPDESVSWHFDRRHNRWVTKVENVEHKRWPLGPLWHCPLYPLPGRPQGMSPIAFHAETIGVGLAAQEFGARFFGDGGHPTMVVQSEKDPGIKGAQALKDLIISVTRGNREPVVLPKGTSLERWQVSPDESQFLDTMRYSGEDVTRIFGVPPGKIGLAVSGQNVTYSNVTDANADWRVSGLTRYVTPLEANLTRLIPGGRSRSLRFNFHAFLRADLAGRASAYKIWAEIGQLAGTPVMLPNEMRAAEGLPPLEGGDEFARTQQTPQPREASHA